MDPAPTSTSTATSTVTDPEAEVRRDAAHLLGLSEWDPAAVDPGILTTVTSERNGTAEQHGIGHFVVRCVRQGLRLPVFGNVR